MTLPVLRNLEQSFVYRNENIPFGFEDPNERRWTVSYNASYPFSERVQGHAGLLYQPFRLDRPYRRGRLEQPRQPRRRPNGWMRSA